MLELALGVALAAPVTVHRADVTWVQAPAPAYPAGDRPAEDVSCRVWFTADVTGAITAVDPADCPVRYFEAVQAAARGARVAPVLQGGAPVEARWSAPILFRGTRPADGVEVDVNGVRWAARMTPVYPAALWRPVTVDVACRVRLFATEAGQLVDVAPLDCGEPFFTAVREAVPGAAIAPFTVEGRAVPVHFDETFVFRNGPAWAIRPVARYPAAIEAPPTVVCDVQVAVTRPGLIGLGVGMTTPLDCPEAFHEAAAAAFVAVEIQPGQPTPDPWPVRLRFERTDEPQLPPTALQVRRRPLPEFPESARDRRAAEACQVRFVLDVDGHPTDLRPYACEEPYWTAARAALEASTYWPAKVDGVPVRAIYVLNFVFRSPDAPDESLRYNPRYLRR